MLPKLFFRLFLLESVAFAFVRALSNLLCLFMGVVTRLNRDMFRSGPCGCQRGERFCKEPRCERARVCGQWDFEADLSTITALHFDIKIKPSFFMYMFCSPPAPAQLFPA